MSLFMNVMSDYVKRTELHDRTFDLIISLLSTTTSASIGTNLICDQLAISYNYKIYGTLNGCNIATTSLSSLGTFPIIPVIKSDSKMEIGRYLDFHYDGTDDHTARFISQSNGTLELSNSKSIINTIDLFSKSSSYVEFHLEQNNSSNKCTVLQYVVIII